MTGGALTAEQCDHFDVNGRVTICHATGSETNPFVIFRTSVAGCISGHEDHENDFVQVGDGECIEGCYPKGAPVGDGDKCCEGLAVVDGVCNEAGDECLAKAEALADEKYASYCPPGNERCDGDAAKRAAEEAFYAYYKANCTAPCLASCKEDDQACKDKCITQTWGGPS